MQVAVNSPVTIYIAFGGCPRYFELRNAKGEIYYFRFPNVPRIKLNIPDVGVYTGNIPFQVVKTTAIKTPDNYPQLPTPERNRWKTPKFIYDASLKGTPAICYSDEGVIAHSPEYYKFPPTLRLFIDLHEIGHFFYRTESYCDQWALTNYLRMGYNRCMAYYALYSLLSRTNENMERLEKIFDNIQKTQPSVKL